MPRPSPFVTGCAPASTGNRQLLMVANNSGRSLQAPRSRFALPGSLPVDSPSFRPADAAGPTLSEVPSSAAKAEIRGLSFRYGAHRALGNVNLTMVENA